MILKGEKVILRPIIMADAPRFVKWLSDPEVNKFTSRKRMNLKEEKQWIKGLSKKLKTEKHFAIDMKDKIHIGSIDLRGIDLRDKKCKLGVLIGDKNYWNKGYGSDAIKILLDYGFKKLKLNRIELGVYSYNQRAIKVYNRLGFKLEGVKREDVFYKNKYHNSFVMGILKREWVKKNKLF